MLRRRYNPKDMERKMSFNAAIGCVVVMAFALGVVGFYLTRKPKKQN